MRRESHNTNERRPNVNFEHAYLRSDISRQSRVVARIDRIDFARRIGKFHYVLRLRLGLLHRLRDRSVSFRFRLLVNLFERGLIEQLR